MKTFLICLFLAIAIQKTQAQVFLEEPLMQVPDSIGGKFVGMVSLLYFVADDGRIVAWQIRSISEWNIRKKQSRYIYQENLKMYFRNAQTGKYESEVKTDFKIKNTDLGTRLAVRLSPWLEEYVKHIRVRIAETSVKPDWRWWDGNKRKIALPYSGSIQIGRYKN